ncbi:hypothetical protein AbraIFM66950_000088 [Aspergillus brasiliensis]|nr:hypothetical protein AbraIFM66950_000088 [Aspergillus brasiliensis]
MASRTHSTSAPGTDQSYNTVMFYLLIIVLLLPLVSSQLIPIPQYPQTLHLHYPNTPYIEPGDTLQILGISSPAHFPSSSPNTHLTHLMIDTKPLPILSTLHLPQNQTYTLLFLDLDVLYNNNTTITVILHWYQPDLISSDNNILIPSPHASNPPRKSATYIAPQPPANSHHRYLYLLYTQPPDYIFPDCFGHIFPRTVEARAGFDVRLFAEAAGLGTPLAGNWFYVRDEVSLPTGSGLSEGGVAILTTTSMRWVECASSSSSSSTYSSTTAAAAATHMISESPTGMASVMRYNQEESQVQAQIAL